ncbi:MAG: aromatic-ring-hydroxylating dioxygenase subunit beta [Betaproteobacteria bacterium]
MTDREAIADLVQRTAFLLDEERLADWCGLFDAAGTYELAAYSTELRKWMTWWHADRPTLEKTLKEVPQHVRDPARRRHVVGAPLVEIAGDEAKATAQFAIFRTTPEGQSSLYLVGRYDDRLVKRGGAWLYAAHKAIADTRMLDAFTHIPL